MVSSTCICSPGTKKDLVSRYRNQAFAVPLEGWLTALSLSSSLLAACQWTGGAGKASTMPFWARPSRRNRRPKFPKQSQTPTNVSSPKKGQIFAESCWTTSRTFHWCWRLNPPKERVRSTCVYPKKGLRFTDTSVLCDCPQISCILQNYSYAFHIHFHSFSLVSTLIDVEFVYCFSS